MSEVPFQIYLAGTPSFEDPIEVRLAEDHQMRQKAQQDRLQQVERDANQPVLADVYDKWQYQMQESIRKAIRAGAPEPPPTPTQSLPSDLAAEELDRALGFDQLSDPTPLFKAEPSPASLPRLVDVRSMGREPLPPGPGLLDRPIADILDRVAERSITERGRTFAREMAGRARALESVS